jgi:hypothetical protein
VEGLNVGGILLGYLGLFVLAAASLVALGLLIAGLTQAARTLFAGGLLWAAVIVAVAVLSFLQKEFRSDGNELVIALTALSLAVAGAGQFAASLRGPWNYAAALGCSATSMLLAASPLLGGDWAGQILGGLGLTLDGLGQPVPAVASLLPAVASVIAAFLPFGPRRAQPGRTADGGRA